MSHDEQIPLERLNGARIQNVDINGEVKKLSFSVEKKGCMRPVEIVQEKLFGFLSTHGKGVKISILALILIFIHVWLGLAMWYRPAYSGIALLVLVAFGWLAVLLYGIIFPVFDNNINSGFNALEKALLSVWKFVVVKVIVYLCLIAIVIFFLIWDTRKNRVRLVSFGGLMVFIVISFLISNNPAKVKWRPVIWGIVMQFVMGLLVLRWDTGHKAFKWAADEVVVFLDYTINGTSFVYGFMAAPPNTTVGRELGGAVFAFSALQTVIYFGAIVAVLYYYGVIQWILVRIARIMQYTMDTTAAESLNAAACIFLGQTEAALLIKPCLRDMTPSEIHAVMTAGYACIAGSLFAAYIAFGACPTYLMSATVMSAPASLAVAKLMLPETKKSKQKDISSLEFPRGEESNVLECISTGAVIATPLVFAIVSNLIVFLALLALLDAIISWGGGMLGDPNITFEQIVGYVFFPLAYVMGSSDASDPQVHIDETLKVAQLMGTKTVLNEFIAYKRLGCMINAGQLGKRATMMATYALCGFSNIGSIGIQLGIMSGMCPEKKSTFAAVAVRGLIAGSFACFMTACVAGVLVETPAECKAPSAVGC